MFPKRLKELRLEEDMKQLDLGKILEVSSSTIGMYEQGRRFPDQETLLKIANFFDVTTDYLLGRTDERNPKKEINNATTIAAHRLGDIEQLPDDAIDEINNYIDLMRLKYLKDKNNE